MRGLRIFLVAVALTFLSQGDSLPIGHRREGVTFPVSPQRSEAATEHFVGKDPTSSETDSHNDPEMTAEKNLRVHNEGLVPGGSLPTGHHREVTFPESPQKSEANAGYFVGQDPASSEKHSHKDPKRAAEKSLRVPKKGFLPSDSLPSGHHREVTFPESPQKTEANAGYFVGQDPTVSEISTHKHPKRAAEKNLRITKKGLLHGAHNTPAWEDSGKATASFLPEEAEQESTVVAKGESKANYPRRSGNLNQGVTLRENIGAPQYSKLPEVENSEFEKYEPVKEPMESQRPLHETYSNERVTGSENTDTVPQGMPALDPANPKVDEEGYVDGKDEFVDKEYWDDEVEAKDWGSGQQLIKELPTDDWYPGGTLSKADEVEKAVTEKEGEPHHHEWEINGNLKNPQWKKGQDFDKRPKDSREELTTGDGEERGFDIREQSETKNLPTENILEANVEEEEDEGEDYKANDHHSRQKRSAPEYSSTGSISRSDTELNLMESLYEEPTSDPPEHDETVQVALVEPTTETFFTEKRNGDGMATSFVERDGQRADLFSDEQIQTFTESGLVNKDFRSVPDPVDGKEENGDEEAYGSSSRKKRDTSDHEKRSHKHFHGDFNINREVGFSMPPSDVRWNMFAMAHAFGQNNGLYRSREGTVVHDAVTTLSLVFIFGGTMLVLILGLIFLFAVWPIRRYFDYYMQSGAKDLESGQYYDGLTSIRVDSNEPSERPVIYQDPGPTTVVYEQPRSGRDTHHIQSKFSTGRRKKSGRSPDKIIEDDKKRDPRNAERRKVIKRQTSQKRDSLIASLLVAKSVIDGHAKYKEFEGNAFERRHKIRKDASDPGQKPKRKDNRRKSFSEEVQAACSVINPKWNDEEKMEQAKEKCRKIKKQISGKRRPSLLDEIQVAREVIVDSNRKSIADQRTEAGRGNEEYSGMWGWAAKYATGDQLKVVIRVLQFKCPYNNKAFNEDFKFGCDSNLFPRVSHHPALNDGKTRDPGNEVVISKRACSGKASGWQAQLAGLLLTNQSKSKLKRDSRKRLSRLLFY